MCVSVVEGRKAEESVVLRVRQKFEIVVGKEETLAIFFD